MCETPGVSAAPRSRATRGVLLSSSDVGSANRAKILQALLEHGPTSRADLARLVNVQRATVSTIATGLIDAGLLVEGDAQRPADGIGKPARPLRFAPYALLSGAVAITRGQVEVAVVDARGEILDRHRSDVATDCAAKDLRDHVLNVAAAALAGYAEHLGGIGVTVPALCDPAVGRVLVCTAVPGLVDADLPDALQARFGVPVRLEQDVRAFAIGEKWFGRGRGRSDFAAVHVGVGVGAGVMLPGHHLLEGVRGYTTQLGHTCVDPDGARCTCGLRGCWETIASTRWLRTEAARRGVTGGRDTTPGRLAKRAESGDGAARQLLGDYADNLAIGMANLVQLLSLRLFIVDGDVVQAGEDFRAELERRVVARCMPALAEGVEVVFSELDQDSGLLGAGAAVLARQVGVSW